MAQFSYDAGFTPPAPVVDLVVSAPGAGKSMQLRGLIDSGADLTVLPQNVIAETGLQYVDEMLVEGFDGVPSVRPIYAAHISIQGGWSMILKVVCIPGEIALVGRDVINRWRLLLDGRAQVFDIT